MPQVFKVGGYLIYFWLGESDPLEPVHVHITDGNPTENATKVWLTRDGHCFLAHNKGHIPARKLRIIMRTIEARHSEIESKWMEYFGTISYYC